MDKRRLALATLCIFSFDTSLDFIMRLSSKPRVNQIPPKLGTSPLRFAAPQLRCAQFSWYLVDSWFTTSAK